LQADQAGRTQGDRWGIPAALGGQFNTPNLLASRNRHLVYHA
jgi:hypothetical protein